MVTVQEREEAAEQAIDRARDSAARSEGPSPAEPKDGAGTASGNEGEYNPPPWLAHKMKGIGRDGWEGPGPPTSHQCARCRRRL